MYSTRCDMDTQRSRWQRDNACTHNTLIPTLDLLQRHAYFEIRSNVQLAVGNRLPAELAQLVFENTLDVEGIGTEPRIVVKATNTLGGPDWKGIVVEKCLLPCEHDTRRPGRSNRGGHCYCYVLGANFESCLPKIPQSINSYSDLLEAESTRHV